MPHENEPHTGDVVEQDEETCTEAHVADIDEGAKRFLSMFSTVRGKLEDLARAESDLKRFELSIEADRKRLQKTLDSAKVALKNARVQMSVELTKVDPAGFTRASQLVKDDNAV